MVAPAIVAAYKYRHGGRAGERMLSLAVVCLSVCLVGDRVCVSSVLGLWALVRLHLLRCLGRIVVDMLGGLCQCLGHDNDTHS